MGRSSQRWGRKPSAFVGDETASVSSTRAEAILLSRVVGNIDSGLANDVSEKVRSSDGCNLLQTCLKALLFAMHY